MKGNLVFCTDSRYAQHLAVLIYSILLHTSVPLNFFVLYSSLNDKDREQLNSLIERMSCMRDLAFTIEFIPVDVKAKLEEHGLNVNSFRDCFDPYTRLFVTEIFAGRNLDKLIYLDVDMVCKGDIAPLVAECEKLVTFGGVLDTVSIKLNYPLITPTYINSGLLLLSLSYLSRINFIEKCAVFIKEHLQDLVCPDQDVINNVISASDLKLISQRYNEYLPSKEKVAAAVILHYTGPFKPWMPQTRWRMKKVYWQAYRKGCEACLAGKNADLTFVKRQIRKYAKLRPVFNLMVSLRKHLGGK